MPAAHGNVLISISLLWILVDLSLFCVDASLRKCVCLKTKPKPEEQAARQNSARSIDEEDSMNLRNSVILDPASVHAF